jgi:phosphate transport system substrate-binding protein
MYFMKKLTLFSILTFLVFSSCSKSNNEKNQEFSGSISISGAFALYPLAVKWAEEFRKIHPDVRIDVQAGGAGKGIADVLGDQVDLGMVSRDIHEEEIKKGAWFVPVTKDAVLPTFNSSNPYSSDILQKGISKEIFIQLWIEGKPLTWGEISGKAPKDPVKVYKRADAAGAAESWAKYLGKKQDDLKGVGVTGDPGLAQAVRGDVFGIGFNNVIYAYDLNTKKTHPGIQIIPIDINTNGVVDPEENFYNTIDDINKAIAEGRYPSPPARELYFVSKGKPTDLLVKAFLQWILTDGQKYVKEAGFINLKEDKIAEAQNKLK